MYANGVFSCKRICAAANLSISIDSREHTIYGISREVFMLLEGKNITLQAAEGPDLKCGTSSSHMQQQVADWHIVSPNFDFVHAICVWLLYLTKWCI